MYQCDFCNYESIYKYNVMRHEEGKHGQNSKKNKPNSFHHTSKAHPYEAIQTGSRILTRAQPITENVQQTSRQTQNVPIQYIEDAKGIIRQWQEAYQNMDTRNKELLNGWQNHNKQWEAAYRQLQAWREEDAGYSEEAQQQLSYLQNNAGR